MSRCIFFHHSHTIKISYIIYILVSNKVIFISDLLFFSNIYDRTYIREYVCWSQVLSFIPWRPCVDHRLIVCQDGRWSTCCSHILMNILQSQRTRDSPILDLENNYRIYIRYSPVKLQISLNVLPTREYAIEKILYI